MKYYQKIKDCPKWPWFTDDMIVYIEKTKDTTKNTVRTNKFGKVVGYKNNTHKKKNPVVFLNTNNELSERESKKIIPYAIASKRIKYLRK